MAQFRGRALACEGPQSVPLVLWVHRDEIQNEIKPREEIQGGKIQKEKEASRNVVVWQGMVLPTPPLVLNPRGWETHNY